MECDMVCSYILTICSVQVQFQWQCGYQVLPSRAAGGIYVYDNFTNSGGRIEISGSSAGRGGAVLMKCSGIGILGNSCRTFWHAMGPVVQLYSYNMFSPSAVSVAVWIPSSASTPQVGFMWKRASPIREEKLRFQTRRRR